MGITNKNIAIIGSGFAGMSAATVLASEGYTTHVFEKNDSIGGRARSFSSDGFLFDMGPSWYWMPDVIERFYNRFGYTAADFYELKKLDPAFQIIFNESDVMQVPAEWESLCSLFESIEQGSAKKLQRFMADAAYKYNVGMNDLVYQPGFSIKELVRPELLKGIFKLHVFSSFSRHVRSFFSDPRLIALMEFPVLFLGAMPQQTPALYSLMNYTGLKQGTYYPMGGFGKVADAMKIIAEAQGVKFHVSTSVSSINLLLNKAISITTYDQCMDVEAVIGTADYHHIEKSLLPPDMKNYSEAYWDKRVFAPSCLLFYLGINKKISRLLHHNLFFDEDMTVHSYEIYKDRRWPAKPLFYVCCPSKTDPAAAPEGMENIFMLMPIAAGLKDTDDIREEYFIKLMTRLEKFAGEKIQEHIIFKRSYCIKDFVSDYNAYKGNAYGLANTLRQTANLKPKMRNKKICNLFYAGQLTVPGPGVPPAVISGQVAAAQLLKHLTA